MLKFKLFLLSACTFMCIPTLFAQETTPEQTRTEMNIVFRVGRTNIDATYMDNAATLDRMVEWVNSVKDDSMVDIVSVEFCGAASPEGSSAINRRLSRERLAALENYLRSKIEIPENLIVRNDQYIPWDNLHKMVSESNLADKAAVLSILEQPATTDNNGLDARIAKLKALNGGRTWNTLYNNFFAQMRNAYTVLVTCKSKKALEMEKQPAPEPEPEPEPEPTPEPEPEPIVEPESAILDYTPKKGDLTISATIGYNNYVTVTAFSGISNSYSASAFSPNWNTKQMMIGIELGWFVHDFWKLTVAGGIIPSTKPGYAGVEGTIDSGSWNNNIGEIPSYSAINAESSLAYTAMLGVDRYFKLRNIKNLMLYTGLRFGTAYCNNQIKSEDWQNLGMSVAETWNLRAAVIFGVDYYVLPSMFVGVSVDPFAYTYGITSYKPQEGLNSLSADIHDYSAFAAPTIRVGFKF